MSPFEQMVVKQFAKKYKYHVVGGICTLFGAGVLVGLSIART